MTADGEIPLVIDMDGTFFSTDSTELMEERIRRRPLRLPGLWRHRRSGDKAQMKLYLHRFGSVDVKEFVPYEPLHAWLAAQHGRRPVFLATGAPRALAEAVAANYPLFEGVFGTRAGHNNTGERKAAALVERFGEHAFDYAGNSEADLAVWRHARRAIVCNAPASLAERAAGVCDVELVL